MDAENQPVKPDTSFVWAIYADATFAGLSPLIPLPFVDNVTEMIFRRRIHRALAKYEQVTLTKRVQFELRREENGCLSACLMLPIFLVVELAGSLLRKFVYVLSVAMATEKVSYYWHYAFLLRYALHSGHLEDHDSARIVRKAMSRALRDTNTSPLLATARQVTSTPGHIWRALRRVRRGKEDAEIAERRSLIAQAWDDFEGYLLKVAVDYDRAYVAIRDTDANRLAEKQARARERAAKREARRLESEQRDTPSNDESIN